MTTAPLSQQRSSLYASRLFHRSPLDVRARLVALHADGMQEIVHGRTSDVSSSGAGMMVTRTLPRGVRVVLCLRMPESGVPLCVQAVVARCQGLKVGLQFVRTTPLQRVQISSLCQA